MDSPTLEVLRMRVIPGMPFSAVSSGKVTRSSVSSGARPGASVIRVTVGLFRSGNTSIDSDRDAQPPYSTRITAAASTRIRCFRLALTR